MTYASNSLVIDNNIIPQRRTHRARRRGLQLPGIVPTFNNNEVFGLTLPIPSKPNRHDVPDGRSPSST